MEQINKQLMSWASILEDEARNQAIATATLPFVFPHVALMPDAHWGMGSTVGSVIPTLDVVMPAAVGVDIGCGMAAVRTQLTWADVEERADLPRLRGFIQDRVPVSPGVYREKLSDTAASRVTRLEEHAEKQGVTPDRYSGRGPHADWRFQLGSLGGGNHFIELCRDEEDRIWVFLHSGSRGVGNKIAKHHVGIAQKLCERWHVQLPHKDLAFLPVADDAFWPYIRDLRWAQAFALANRAEMVDQVFFALEEWWGGAIDREETINTHHNYTERYCIKCRRNPDSDSRLPGRPSVAQSDATAPDSPAGCRPSDRSCGGPPPSAGEDGPASSASRGGAPVRTDASPNARPPAQGSSRSPCASSCQCSSGDPGCTAAASSSAWSTSGRDSGRPYGAGTARRTSGRGQGRNASDAQARANCTHLGNDSVVWLTRKGAIDASEGKLGLIPGSMGTRSYVVEGLGNRLAFNSAPHGAGRAMSRRKARDTFTAADLTAAMEGIEWRGDIAEALVDEIPGAYKDVDVVMADAADLVAIKHTLSQVLNVKGN